MRKYIKLAIKLISFSTKRYMENRMNTLATILISFLSLGLIVGYIEIIFSYTDIIAGWKREEVIFLVGVARVVGALFSMLFLRSINFLPQYVRTGELDILLTKPVSSQFYLSLRLNRPFEIFNLMGGISVCWYGLNMINMDYGILNILLFSISLVAGLFVLYGVYYSIATLSIWFTSFFSLPSIFYIIREPINIPIDAFGKGVSFVLYYILPLAFIVTVPAGILLDKETFLFFALNILFSFFWVGFSIWFWKFALKYYTSASS